MVTAAEAATTHLEWKGAVRIIRSLFPPIDLFEDIADPADWPLLIAAEQKTNPRLMETIGHLDLVPSERRVSGPGASWLMAPFTPHLAEECWTQLGEAGMVLDAPWPVYDAALAADDQVTLPVQIGGKRRGEVVLPRGSDNATVEAAALANPTVQAYLAANNLSIRKVIVVPDRIVNLVAG